MVGWQFKLKYDGPLDVRWFGAKGDGSDDTIGLQDALNQSGAIYIPTGTYGISSQLIVTNETTITLDPTTEIRNFTNSWTVPDMPLIRVHGTNITIIGNGGLVNLDHASGLETQHAIRVVSGENISIQNVRARSRSGDGIYLNDNTNNQWIDGLNLVGCLAFDCYRQGLTIAGGKNILVKDCVFRDSNGTAPEAGIDIEQHYVYSFIQNVRIVDTTTMNNAGRGIVLGNIPAGNTNANYEITIQNHFDYGSSSGFGVGPVQAIPGIVRYIDGTCVSNQTAGIVINRKPPSGYKIEIVRPTVIDCNVSGNINSKYGSAIIVNNEVSQNEPLGGITIDSATVKERRSPRLMRRAIHVENESGNSLTDIYITGNLELDAGTFSTPIRYFAATGGKLALVGGINAPSGLNLSAQLYSRTNGVNGTGLFGMDSLGNEFPLTGYAASGNGIINVKDFGAKGTGTDDDTAAWNAAIAAAAGTTMVVLPSGSYLVNGTNIQGNSVTNAWVNLATGTPIAQQQQTVAFRSYEFDLPTIQAHTELAFDVLDPQAEAGQWFRAFHPEWPYLSIVGSCTSDGIVHIKLFNSNGIIINPMVETFIVMYGKTP